MGKRVPDPPPSPPLCPVWETSKKLDYHFHKEGQPWGHHLTERGIQFWQILHEQLAKREQITEQHFRDARNIMKMHNENDSAKLLVEPYSPPPPPPPTPPPPPPPLHMPQALLPPPPPRCGRVDTSRASQRQDREGRDRAQRTRQWAMLEAHTSKF